MNRVFTPEENTSWAEQLAGKMTSACLAVRHADKVLMVKASYKEHWTFPSGVVDEGESPKAAALRETKEESGLEFEPGDCRFLGVVYTAGQGVGRDRFNFGFTVNITDNNVSLDIPNDEIDDAKWVDVGDIYRMSGARGSYEVFQGILSGLESTSVYTENI